MEMKSQFTSNGWTINKDGWNGLHSSLSSCSCLIIISLIWLRILWLEFSLSLCHSGEQFISLVGGDIAEALIFFGMITLLRMMLKILGKSLLDSHASTLWLTCLIPTYHETSRSRTTLSVSSFVSLAGAYAVWSLLCSSMLQELLDQTTMEELSIFLSSHIWLMKGIILIQMETLTW